MVGRYLIVFFHNVGTVLLLLSKILHVPILNRILIQIEGPQYDNPDNPDGGGEGVYENKARGI